MKTILLNSLFVTMVMLWGCGQKSHDHDHMMHDHDAEVAEEGSNDALYNEVMKIHDEAMLKMNDLYSLKQVLNSKLADSASVNSKKGEIQNAIAKLDSAQENMMIWMRAFNPIPDSLGEEKAREYLETEMEKVKQVRENITEALEEGKALK